AGPRALLGPLLVLFALATIALVAAWSGVLRIPPDVLATLDGSARRLAATGQSAPGSPLDVWRPLLARGAVIFGIGTVALAVALWPRAAAAGGVVRAEAAVPPLGRGPGALGRAHPGAGERPPHRADGWAMALFESCRSGYLRPMMVR